MALPNLGMSTVTLLARMGQTQVAHRANPIQPVLSPTLFVQFAMELGEVL